MRNIVGLENERFSRSEITACSAPTLIGGTVIRRTESGRGSCNQRPALSLSPVRSCGEHADPSGKSACHERDDEPARGVQPLQVVYRHEDRRPLRKNHDDGQEARGNRALVGWGIRAVAAQQNAVERKTLRFR